MVGNINANGIPFIRNSFIDRIRQSMVLWYDIKRQGATNENMKDNPILKDLSGNGHDATCYNFNWNALSGISQDNISLENAVPLTSSPIKLSVVIDSDNRTITATYTPIYGTRFIDIAKIPLKKGTYSIVNKSDRPFLVDDVLNSIPANNSKDITIEEDRDITIIINRSSEVNDVEVTDIYKFGISYKNALVSDAVDDYVKVEGLPNIHSLFIKYDRITQDTTVWRYLYNSQIPNTTDDYRWFAAINPSSSFFKSDPAINGDGYAQKVTDIITNERTFDIFAYGYGSLGAFALYSIILFNRTLTNEEINWVKTNLIDGDTEL